MAIEAHTFQLLRSDAGDVELLEVLEADEEALRRQHRRRADDDHLRDEAEEIGPLPGV